MNDQCQQNGVHVCILLKGAIVHTSLGPLIHVCNMFQREFQREETFQHSVVNIHYIMLAINMELKSEGEKL